ncbi:MAG: redox-regulated ATPase YchF [Candidatus Diapherotrites archaeon]|nr:redox-regulated ATPase YchF [Candidatus Diapherotrites archaeon]
MKVAVVGKPSSGKTTFFSAATLVDAEISARPFTTIKPNHGTAYVRAPCPCKELGRPCNPRNSKCEDGVRLVPVQVVDVAGLVPGAHDGRGMGNQFLADLADAQALIHVVDASGRLDTEGNAGNGDPVADAEMLENEVDYWMLGILKKGWSGVARRIEMHQTTLEEAIQKQFSGLGVSLEDAKEVVRSLGMSFTEDESELFRLVSSLRKKCKPIAVAANKMDLPSASAGLEALNATGRFVVPTCAEAELALRRAAQKGLIRYVPGASSFEVVGGVPEQQGKALGFIASLLGQFGGTGVQELVDKVVYDFLGLIVVYPVEDETHWCDKKGNVLPDAFLLPNGSTALDLAKKVHTEVAEKMKGAVDCRTRRKIGKDHVLRNNDVVRILV